MKRGNWAVLGAGILCVTIVIGTGWAQRVRGEAGELALLSSHTQATPQTPAAQTKSATPTKTAAADANIVATYCTGCHNDKSRKGELSLSTFDLAKAADDPELTEKMIRKLQAGLMPPPGSRRPAPDVYAAFINALETRVDAAAALHPNPGGRTFPRLNRPEYRAAIRELLALDVDPGAWLPLDQKSANFDNIADEQTLSATLLESYLNAAGDISRMAIGDRNAPVVDRTYTNSSYLSQHPWDHLDGAPFGTRGGVVVNHVFPADAEYVFSLAIIGGDNSRMEDIDISIDGVRVALMRYENGQSRDADGRGATPIPTEPIFIKAGQHKLAAAFVRRSEGPYEDLIRPHDWSYAGGGSGGTGITTLPHLRDLIVHGPVRATGISETPSRQKVFVCRPTMASDERACAKTIIAKIGGEAYRRPLTTPETDGILKFYDAGAAKGGFENGVRTALEAILSSPYFIFRLERQPEGVRPGAIYRISDYDLASRLSFFLWGTPPDKELLAAASRGELSMPKSLERHARRMLADKRADALSTRFAAQWLRLQDIDKVHPDPNLYPNFGDNIALDMQHETEAFFTNLLREDRSVLDLYRADYTFVNERLARHYGFPGVAGPEFRRMTYPDETRRGILGQGSMLVQTSFANRTSPVLRGKWVMEVLLGTPPPPPPMDGSVPPFENTAEAKNGRALTTRERMEMHRENPTCNSCHRFMDPIGLALDHFDVTAKWRQRETGSELDTNGDFYDGTPVSTPAQLSAALLKRPIPLLRTFTENLFAYALGRRSEYFDQPTIRGIVKAAQATNYKVSSFILGVVGSDAFRMKRADAAVDSTKTDGKKDGGKTIQKPSER
jgi:cytochrome c553